MYFFFLLLICFIVVPFLPWTHLCVSSSLLIYFFSRSDSFIDNDVLNSLFCSFIRSARFGLSLSLFSFRCMPVLYSSQCVSAPILKVFSSLILSLSQRDQYIHFTIFILSLVLLLCDFQVHSILLVLVLVRLVIFVSYLGSHYNVLLLFKLERIRWYDDKGREREAENEPRVKSKKVKKKRNDPNIKKCDGQSSTRAAISNVNDQKNVTTPNVI